MSDDVTVRFGLSVFAGENERFAEDVKLPEPGTEAMVNIIGRREKATIVDARRKNSGELIITYAVTVDSATGRALAGERAADMVSIDFRTSDTEDS